MVDIVIIPMLQALAGILNFYQIVIFVSIIMTWLVVLGILDLNRFSIFANIFMLSRAVTEPIYAYVRRFLPTFGPIDFSPIVVVLLTYMLVAFINKLIIHLSVVY